MILSGKKQKPSWIFVETLSDMETFRAEVLYDSGILDPGESEAVILAQRFKADWLLTDDTSARVFANAIGLEVHGSLGIVLWAAAVGHLQYDEAKTAIDRLSKSSLWISQAILKKAYKALEEMFSK